MLRRLGQIDHTALPLLRYRPKELTVTNLLRLGAAQLLFLSTPPHAAVAETVRLAAGGFRREMPMLNAVLRKLAAEGRTLLEGQDAPRLNTPKWLWDSWAAAYGEERARAIAEAHQVEPPLDLSVAARPRALGRASSGPRSCRPARCAGAAAGWSTRCRATTRAPGGCRTPPRPCPPLLLGEVKGRRVLDIGAAPGGKTAQLARHGCQGDRARALAHGAPSSWCAISAG